MPKINYKFKSTGKHNMGPVSTERPSTLVWAFRGEAKIDGLLQERRNSSALAMELRLSCTNPSRWS